MINNFIDMINNFILPVIILIILLTILKYSGNDKCEKYKKHINKLETIIENQDNIIKHQEDVIELQDELLEQAKAGSDEFDMQ